jgi:gamma-glutamyltranspeptidase / glutathione hydrolase
MRYFDSVSVKKAPWRSLFCLLLCYAHSLLANGPGVAAIATAHPLATEAGHEILRQGGNAFDAAVAVSAVLAVVEPYSSGIGGGGFWLLHRARDGYQTMVDGRERAPLAAHRKLYLDEAGAVVPGLSINGPLATGIPGEPAALVHISK